MRDYYTQPPMTPLRHPTGSDSTDIMLVRLEERLRHETQARILAERQLFELVATIRQEIDAINKDRAALILKVGFWAISGLLAALWALAYSALTNGSPALG
mgnify:CR=1 FL=1